MIEIKGEKHCEVSTCKQRDFLPFNCNLCSGTFCLDHRTYTTHDCTKLHLRKDKKTPICPLCEKPLLLTDLGKNNSTLDVIVSTHIESGCKLGTVEERKRRNICSLSKCKKTMSIPITCHSCNNKFCVTHRHASRHNCASLRRNTIRRVTEQRCGSNTNLKIIQKTNGILVK